MFPNRISKMLLMIKFLFKKIYQKKFRSKIVRNFQIMKKNQKKEFLI